jgi:nucleoside-diphosphate-sugar epimerase
MDQKVVVFGGAGFIGSHLVRELHSTNRYSRIVVADIADDPRVRTAGVEYTYCDVRNPISNDLCAGVTEIYNLAAIHKTPGHDDWEYYWTNVLGATNVCQFATQNSINFIAFTSSISIYGPSEDAKDERLEPAPESAYGRSKYAAECIHAQWQAEGHGARRLVVVRPAVIYGLGEHGNFTRLGHTLRVRLFLYPGRRDTIKACGYVEDLVAALLWARDRDEPSLTFNFCHPERYTSEQICKAFERVAGYRRPLGMVPLSIVLGFCWLCAALEFFGIHTPINRERVMKLNRSTNIVPARLQDLGFPYRFDLEQGLCRWHAASTVTDFD